LGVLAAAGPAQGSVRLQLSWSDPNGQSDGQPPFAYVATPYPDTNHGFFRYSCGYAPPPAPYKCDFSPRKTHWDLSDPKHPAFVDDDPSNTRCFTLGVENVAAYGSPPGDWQVNATIFDWSGSQHQATAAVSANSGQHWLGTSACPDKPSVAGIEQTRNFKARVTRKRGFRVPAVKFVCPGEGPACAVRLTAFTRRGGPLAVANYQTQVPAGSQRALSAKLSAKGFKRLERVRNYTAHFHATVKRGWPAAEENLHVHLTAPKEKKRPRS
jgi:hypothetical protein